MAKKKTEKATNFNFQHTRKDGSFRTWFRGEATNFNPKAVQMVSETAVLEHVITGWEPKEPYVDSNTQITAFGSCFAANISNWLAARNYNILTKDDGSKAYVVTCGEGMVNSFVIRQQFEWAFENKRFEESLWHGYKAEEYGYDEEIRKQTLEMFSNTDLFILTFGLSEVWYDKETGGVFWRSIPMDKYDEKRHKFRVTTVEENKENILAIYRLIRKHRPDAKIVTTLSPIPLIATFRPVSCISANSVSKSILRVAIDEVYREVGDEGYFHYWPSYEIVTDVFHSPYKADRRHLPATVLNFIMILFEKVWCKKQPTDAELLEYWVAACSSARLITDRIEVPAQKHDLAGLDRVLKKKILSRIPEVNDEVRDLIERLRVAIEKQG